MRIVPVFLAALLLFGCGSKPENTGLGAEAYLLEKPGSLPPDRTALRVAQQFSVGGLSNELRLALLVSGLNKRNRAPSYEWKVEPAANGTFLIKARLTARERHDSEFQWKVDFSLPPHLVCQPANSEAQSLNRLKVTLDEEGLKDYLGPVLKDEPAKGAPTPSSSK